MTILTTVTLCGLFMALVALVERTRSANLDYMLHLERAITNELTGQLHDATRNAAYWQERADALLCENSTLVVDLEHSEERLRWLESLHQARKGETAGVRLVARCVDAKLTVAEIAP